MANWIEAVNRYRPRVTNAPTIDIDFLAERLGVVAAIMTRCPMARVRRVVRWRHLGALAIGAALLAGCSIDHGARETNRAASLASRPAPTSGQSSDPTNDDGGAASTVTRSSEHIPAYPGYEPESALLKDVTDDLHHGRAGTMLAGRGYAILDAARPDLAVVTDSGFKVLDVSGDLPTSLSKADEDARTVAEVPGIAGVVAVDGRYAYVAGIYFYGPDSLFVVDVSEPLSPRLVSKTGMPIGAWFHGSVLAEGGRLYIVRNDQQLVIYDTSDPKAPRELGSTFVNGRSPIYRIHDALLVYGDVVDVSDPAKPVSRPESARKWPYLENSIHWAVIGTRAYLVYRDSVLVLDVSDPFDMKPIGRVPVASTIDGTYRDGDLLVVTYRDSDRRTVFQPSN